MATYKDLKDNFLEEVSKIDVSKLSLGGFGNTYKDYAELLKSISELREDNFLEKIGEMGFGIKPEVPKKDEVK